MRRRVPAPRIIMAIAVVAFAAAIVAIAPALALVAVVASGAAVLALGWRATPAPAAAAEPPPVAAAEDDTMLIDAFAEPVLIVGDGQVLAANRAATDTLGSHIVGADVRLALRHPAAAEMLLSDDEGAVIVPAPGGQRFELRVVRLRDRRKLVRLIDRSAHHAAERARVDFVANASHELRTPLASVLGYVETLGDAKAGGDPAIRARFLGIIAREAQRMQRLIDELITLSRIESERFHSPDVRIDLAAIVRLAAADGAQPVELALRDDVPMVAADAGQVAQVARNLIDNAFKYGRAPVRVALTSEPGWAVLSVADAGDGIAPEHLPRLTERFYRVDPGRSRAVGGTGLGLAIVKHVVERHRGRLDMVSTPTTGTVVTVRLPLPGDAVT